MARVAAFLLVLVFSCYLAIVQGYGDGYNPLSDTFNAHIRRALHERAEPPSELPTNAEEPPINAEEQEQPPAKEESGLELFDQTGLKEADKVASLPGQPIVKFKQYAGYVTIDNIAGRALFYYFVECTKEPWKKPLVLWLNGGPGCSSVGTGAMREIGPFRVKKDGRTLKRNKHAWNKKANILFLEFPAGVGFSYSNRTEDYLKSGDKIASIEAYSFLLNWLNRFPEYKSRDFYIAGESYGGHYVTQLALLILNMNREAGDPNMIINLRGIVLGNALIDDVQHMKGATDFYFSHAIISKELRDNIVNHCDFSLTAVNAEICEKMRKELETIIAGINIYNIYASLCVSPSNSPYYTDFDPCSEYYINTYLNTPEVQKVIHANTTGLPYRWVQYSKKIGDAWTDREPTVLPIVQELMNFGIRIWFYSGDVDGCVPVTSTQYVIEELGLPIKTGWHAWQSGPKEVGGYVVEYQNLTFVTVRGSGHMVPSDQPVRALVMFSSFLEGKLPPEDTSKPEDVELML